jgi:hypothetical protein
MVLSGFSDLLAGVLGILKGKAFLAFSDPGYIDAEFVNEYIGNFAGIVFHEGKQVEVDFVT